MSRTSSFRVASAAALLSLTLWNPAAAKPPRPVSENPVAHKATLGEVDQLHGAARAQYPWPTEIQNGTYGMSQFSMVDYGKTRFALTTNKAGHPKTYAVWKQVDGRWKWLFDYADLAEMNGSSQEWDTRINGFYEKLHGLDRKLRKALEDPARQVLFPSGR